jgi:hypothetical protein
MADANLILAEAEKAVGIKDSDRGVRGNLERLVESLTNEFSVSEAGEQRIQRSLLRDTVARLNGLKWVRDFPEITAEPIVAPVFLMGLPRSGTTYLQYLFDRDQRFRLIRTWESMAPSPPPGFDPDSAKQRKTNWAISRQPTFEGFDALHLIDAEGSDECHAFLEQSFGAAGLHNLYRVPTYFDYILDGLDLEETYRIHKRQLQLLQWRSAARPWALKYPNHVIALDSILTVHPDARFVMTHRDPVQTLASISKMTASLRGLCAAVPVDPYQVGRDMLHFIQRHIDRIMTFDAGPYGGRVVHVDYYALLEDPVREMHAIHRAIDIATPTDVAEAVAAWHAENPKNARGRNDYALAQYGLDDAAIAEQFKNYMRRFVIPREHEGLTRIRTRP